MAGNNKVVKYHRNSHFDMGFIFFFIIIIYVIVSIFSYITSSPVAVYEVQQGTIATNNVYRGLILRDETIEYSNQAGYLNYFVKSGAKVSVKDVVCSIDTNGEISKKIDSVLSDGTVLDAATIGLMLEEINGFTNSYNSVDYSSVYSFKQKLASELNQKLSNNALHNLSSEVNNAEQNNTFFPVTSNSAGVISYIIDGFETKKLANIKEKDFNINSLESINLETVKEVKVLDPVYKRINSEQWNIIIPISETLAEQLKETSAIKIRFCKDNYTLNTACSITKNDGVYLLNLELIKGMVRYIDQRYVDVELVLNARSGLKIPNTAIVNKEFYIVPKEYFSVGGDSNSPGVLIKYNEDGKENVKLIKPTIYSENDDYYYIDGDEVKAGDVIQKSDSNNTYIVGKETDSLEGVYNVNKGYAVFKQISVISSNDEYSIIEPKTSYGLILYDHIALDGSKVKENQTVLK